VRAAGDVVFWWTGTRTPAGDAWATATVDTVAGRMLTLTASLSGTVPAGTLVWPVVLGKFVARDAAALTGDLAAYSFTLSFRTENATRSAGLPDTHWPEPQTAITIPTDDPYRVPTDGWPCRLERINLLQKNLFTPVAQVRATTPLGTALTSASGPTWETAPDPSGPWTPVFTTTQEATAGLWAPLRPFQTDLYLRVSIPFFGTTAYSNPVLIPAVTVERLMRVTQERYHDVLGTYITWPVRSTDSAAPGNFPAEGFYAADFAADAAASVHTREVALLEAIRVALRTTNFSTQYSQTAAGIVGQIITPETNAFSSVWTFNAGGGFTLPSYGSTLNAVSSLPSAVTTSNRLTLWRDLARFVLRLTKAQRVLAPDSRSTTRAGIVSQSSGDLRPNVLGGANLLSAAQSAWNAASATSGAPNIGFKTFVNPTSVTHFPWGDIYNCPGTVELYGYAGGFSYDMTGKTGAAKLYRSTYYGGYSLSQIGVVGQEGLTPFYGATPDGLTAIYYNGYGQALNTPLGVPGAHTKFAAIADVTAADSVPAYRTGIYCNASSITFHWWDVFPTTSGSLRDIEAQVVCVCIHSRSPDPVDGHWTHNLHVLA
jgi:hypothetical protein